MFNNTLNPILLEWGIFQIRWYGLMYVIAFILGYFIILKISNEFDVELSKDDVADLFVYLAMGMVIFARLMHVIVYHPMYYFQNPLSILAIWNGGLSFHGGLIGFVLAGWYFSKKKNIPFLKLADIIAIPTSLGLVFGRIGNFINGELVGRITNVPWCFNFKGYDGCRHPSQIYESFKNIIIFTTLWQFKGKKPDGFLFFLLMIMYAVLRSIIEQFWRMPEGYIIGLTQGQFLNIFVLIAGIVGMIYIYKR